MSIDIIQGDARAVLEGLPAASVHCVITSPPYYNLRDYGTATWEGGDAACDHMKPLEAPRSGRAQHLAQGNRRNEFGGPTDLAQTDGRRSYRGACGRCGAQRVDAQIGAEATPAAYVAHLVEVFRAVHRVLRPDGTCWVVIGDSYANTGGHACQGATSQRAGRSNVAAQNAVKGTVPEGIRSKNLLMIPHRVALALQAEGWYVRNDCVWAKGSAMPESVQDRFSRAHEYVFHLAKSERYYFDPIAAAEDARMPSHAHTSRGAHGAAFGSPTRGPELVTTLRTDNGTVGAHGWCDLGLSQVRIGAPMALEADGFQVIEPIGLQVGIETAERAYVMDLKSVTSAAATAGVAIAVERLLAHGSPIQATIPDIAAAPCGAVLTGHVGADPGPAALAGAKVAAFELALVAGELLAARVTVHGKAFEATLLVWGPFSASHDGSVRLDGPTNTYRQKRNRRTVLHINPQPFSAADFGVKDIDHYAVFPEKLVEILTLCSTSEAGCCPRCSTPWRRVVERYRTHNGERAEDLGGWRDADRASPQTAQGDGHWRYGTVTECKGWAAGCSCDAGPPLPCTTLDPFLGSGTVALVSKRLGRSCVGIELNPAYVALAEARCASTPYTLFSAASSTTSSSAEGAAR